MLRPVLLVVLTAILPALTPFHAQAEPVCTVIADVSSAQILLRQGDCERRVTPASTFKIPLAVMGFESGVLQSGILPELSWRKGEPDWGGKAWKQPTTPRSWMKHSVVWYSQRIAASLGPQRLTDYGQRFHYGNADFAGDPGKGNGLERAWIASSLKVSPDEQVAFLSALQRGTLPVKPEAMAAAIDLLERFKADGWTISGKTGSAFPRKADGSFDRNRGWGWFVGLAEKDGRKLAFAHLTQDEGPVTGSAGLRTRDALLADWPALVTGR
ncbi:class D beta-lactamase [Pannonibacter carbonis]|uniref:class D beta-lactamase n=1 Tax=Pannonibacter carbonis TaxID=2067569 RepID=UPI000D10ECB5|nr:class D beta-lactamase [Pannonibacter carbonis]